ncbi:MAG: fumarylacetoacetate hydrolase family protein [Chloroflexi bacterium]|nr:fumarylacetoacetate hydrolase family protein [Chloroflexota bacterium]MCH8868569.1 fumarylacetoacetate hydrolase family protein [Chloroflexota bacterium]MCH9038524.1 fumarylacetoacetate hydrolase family protein [Chloroflexota bacterium]MCI0790910.1 fumarylacetoacetate hydrolase family protein [Chloroflexota bacterium]MCI0795206.1 fumarylacetoacetate hydrolase family protein [Chloroflexota bacterium]
MKYYRLISAEDGTRLAVETQEGVLTDLTSLDEDVTDLEDLASAASISGLTIDEVAERLMQTGQPDLIQLEDVLEASSEGEGSFQLDRPFEPPEVWAAGVTYKNSEIERRRESDTPDVYSNVYVADRPELFFKATPDRCVGPFEFVGIREDSPWNIPEPELAFVLYKGEIIGYTIGNDMSSRSIEGENPLYLPQAKVFNRCCAIGPCFVTAESIGDPQDLGVSCVIIRDGEEVFSGETSTSEMARTCEELADWVQRHNFMPNMTTVLTGTAIVPPPDFTLEAGDTVVITVEGIGTLENEVMVV